MDVSKFEKAKGIWAEMHRTHQKGFQIREHMKNVMHNADIFDDSHPLWKAYEEFDAKVIAHSADEYNRLSKEFDEL